MGSDGLFMAHTHITCTRVVQPTELLPQDKPTATHLHVHTRYKDIIYHQDNYVHVWSGISVVTMLR